MRWGMAKDGAAPAASSQAWQGLVCKALAILDFTLGAMGSSQRFLKADPTFV